MQNKYANFFPVDLNTNGKKIIFASVPAHGHFNPMTGLAKHLQANGHDVRWYCSSEYAGKLKKLGIPHYPFKKALEATGNTLEEVMPERKKIKNPVNKLNFDIINFFILRGPEYYTDLMEIYQTFPFECMIADNAFTGIPFIKDKMDIPVISIGVFPLSENSKDLAPCGLGMTPSKSKAGRLKQSLLRFIADKILFRKSNKVMKAVLDAYDIPHNDTNVFDLLVKKSSVLLQSGTPGFEYYRSDLGKNIRFAGAFLPHSSGRSSTSSWYDKRIDQYDSIVLVTQGTIEKDVEKLLVPALEAFRNTNTLVIATTGGSQTNELRLRFPAENIIIEDFIPFNEVMPYADVYISNGGYGGVMLGIRNKLPMVVAGIHEGKNEINARIGYFRLGINLKTETPEPAQIREAVKQICMNTAYKKNVEKLAEEFTNYEPNKICEMHVRQLTQSMDRYTKLFTDQRA